MSNSVKNRKSKGNKKEKHGTGTRYNPLERDEINTEKRSESEWSLDRSAKRQFNPSPFKRVWSCDNNKYANQIYTKHFGEENHHSGDIRRIDPREIPSHDLFCAGFPCQAFSVAGKRQGFKDTRGTLFFEICRIAEHHRPSMLLLENVKGLLSHDGGRTFGTILEALEELGYWWEYQVLNSKYFGVPQNRERVFIIGHLRTGCTEAIFPITEANRDFTEPCGEAQGEGKRVRVANTLSVGGSGRERNLIANTMSSRYNKDGSENLIFVGGIETSKTKKWLEDGNEYSRNFPQGQRVYSANGINPTLSSNAGGLGAKTGLVAISVLTPERLNKRQHGRRFKENGEPAFTLTGQDQHGLYDGAKIRRLTPVECERLQGFPDGWTEGISDTQRYKCLGNAVTVNVIEYLGGLIQSSFSKSKRMDVDG